MLMGIGIIDGKRRFVRNNGFWEYTEEPLNNGLLLTHNRSKFFRLEKPPKFDVPVPEIRVVRDFYAFESHARNARKRRGLDMEPEWYNIPAFYYQNPTTLVPTDSDISIPDFTNELDFEAEIAFVIGKEGISIKKENALDHILGFMLANDWSARDIQRQEMKIGLGPAKSKDFGTTIGPYISTKEGLLDYMDDDRIKFDIDIYLNGLKIRSLNTEDMYWSLGDMISFASRSTKLNIGDVFMTGTLAGGSRVELGEEFLKPRDVVRFTSKQLGTIENRVI